MYCVFNMDLRGNIHLSERGFNTKRCDHISQSHLSNSTQHTCNVILSYHLAAVF